MAGNLGCGSAPRAQISLAPVVLMTSSVSLQVISLAATALVVVLALATAVAMRLPERAEVNHRAAKAAVVW